LRTAAYSIYARQEIWCRPAGEQTLSWQPVDLTEASEDDLPEIHALYGNIIPKLVQQITYLPQARSGYVYRHNERVEGFVGVAQGKQGVYLTPLLHPDAFRDAPAIIAAAAAQANRSASVPVYVRVRRYQAGAALPGLARQGINGNRIQYYSTAGGHGQTYHCRGADGQLRPVASPGGRGSAKQRQTTT